MVVFIVFLAAIAIVLCSVSAIDSCEYGMKSLEQIERDMMDKDDETWR